MKIRRHPKFKKKLSKLLRKHHRIKIKKILTMIIATMTITVIMILKTKIKSIKVKILLRRKRKRKLP